MCACSYMVRFEACFPPPQMCAHTRTYRGKKHMQTAAHLSLPHFCVCFKRCLLHLRRGERASLPLFILFVEVLAGAVEHIHHCVMLLFDLNTNKGKILIFLCLFNCICSLLNPQTDLRDLAWHLLIIQSTHPLLLVSQSLHTWRPIVSWIKMRD